MSTNLMKIKSILATGDFNEKISTLRDLRNIVQELNNEDLSNLFIILKQSLYEGDFQIRNEIQGILLNLDKKSTKFLKGLLKSPKWEVRSFTIETLGQIKGIEMKIFLNALDDEEPAVISNAIKGLPQFGQKAIEPLKAMLRHEVWLLQQDAATALGALGELSLDILLQELYWAESRATKQIVNSLISIGKPAVNGLIKYISSPDHFYDDLPPILDYIQAYPSEKLSNALQFLMNEIESELADGNLKQDERELLEDILEKLHDMLE
ncbi:MAG: HEAT repeat domain-containing protein [Promethearchaeota archaeon]